MKKILAILVLLCPLIVKAQDIDNYYINATLSKDGNLIVEEYIETKKIDGYFERDIYYRDEYVNEISDENILEYTKLNDAKNIDILTVGSVDRVKKYIEEITGVKEFNKVNVGSVGDTGIYLLRNDEGKDYIRIYRNNNDAYYLKYMINDLAVKFNDLGEIYFNVLKNNHDNIKKLIVTVNLPNNSKAYSFNEGKNITKEKNSNYKVEYQYRNIKENEDIRLRIFFDKNLIEDSSKEKKIDVESKVLELQKDSDIFANTVDKFLEIVILVLVIINYLLLVNYTHKGLINYEKLSQFSTQLQKRNIYLKLIIGILMIIVLSYLRLLGIVLLIMGIIVTSYMINKNKDDKKIKYIGVMYVLIMFICCFNLLKNNSIIYILLSLFDMVSLYNLALMEKVRKLNKIKK